ncbi:hypothetical protein [Sagittula sp. S175]|uniref:hypothetical protein n=1 Tax=Sagittula sp. S175 TaxID=3415129 RepID=UPI003C79E188
MTTALDRIGVPQALRRALSGLAILLLGLSLVLAAVPASAAHADPQTAPMQDCIDCPEGHHASGSDPSMPDCHHGMSVAVATLPAAVGVSTVVVLRAPYALPAPEAGPHRSPEHDLPPPRA